VKRLNARRVKIHRSYTVDEAARLFGVHKNTVRAWIKSGLQTIDDRRPILVLGRHLAKFLHDRRQRTIQRCQAGQLYCVRCRAPKNPAARMADYIPITSSSGNLRARCPDCGTLMHRRVSLQNLTAVAVGFEVAVPERQHRIADCSSPSLNSDFDEVA
jgi:helix-turn-helix protein